MRGYDCVLEFDTFFIAQTYTYIYVFACDCITMYMHLFEFCRKCNILLTDKKLSTYQLKNYFTACFVDMCPLSAY